jgi:hypothetical protein
MIIVSNVVRSTFYLDNFGSVTCFKKSICSNPSFTTDPDITGKNMTVYNCDFLKILRH